MWQSVFWAGWAELGRKERIFFFKTDLERPKGLFVLHRLLTRTKITSKKGSEEVPQSSDLSEFHVRAV